MEIQLNPQGNYVVSFAYRPHLVNLIKQIPGRTFNPTSKAWIVPGASKPHLESMAKRIINFEPVNWTDSKVAEKRVSEVDFLIPEMPELAVPHGLKVEPYPYQLQGIARGLQLKRFMNTDEPGLGKSETLNSLISSPNGWIRMGDIQAGDSIFAKDGSIQQVEGVFPQGIVPTYRMTFNDGSFVDCNLEHIWCVRDQNRRRRGLGWTTKTTQEILKSGLVNKTNPKREASGRKPSLKWEIPMCEPVQFPTKQFVIPAYTLGVLIGDGALSGNKVEMSLPAEKKQIIRFVENELDKSLTVSIRNYGNVTRYALVNAFDKFHHENLYLSEIRRLKLDVVSADKFIPKEYLQGDVIQREDLLAGLMDTDGSCIKNRTTFHTTSTQLATDIKELVESLGGVAIIRPYDRTNEGKGIEYQVNIRTSFNPFYLKYKSDNWKPKSVYRPTRYIESIEYIGEEEQQCIRVSSPDHLYLTNNYIVTHNTLQSIATINLANAFPCLVICPSSLKINWEREWHKFTNKKAMVLSDSVRDTWPFFWNTGMYQVFIVNYESLKKYFVQHIKTSQKLTIRDITFRDNIHLFKSVIIDESHRCKSSATQQAKFVKGISEGKEWRIELTGTPVVNRPKDLIAQLSILGKMEEFGGYKYFIQRYCSGPNEASNLKELNFMLWQKSMFRREKSMVLKDLPDKIRQVMSCDITNRKEYKDAERDLIQYLIKYKEADDEKIQKALKGEVMVRINILRQISARGKVKEVAEFVSDFQEEGQKIVLFCSLHEVVDQLKRIFPHAVSVTGREDSKQKQAAVDAFQRNPKTNIIICSIRAAGVGLTLTAASNVAFVEFPWTYADCCQCEDRCHRIGQKDSVTAYYFLGKNTIDEKVYKIIQLKKGIANAVTGATDDIPENIVDMVANLFNEEIDE
ncbi:SNF2-related protein [Gaoshiqia sediminis]|uniref:SNF2-related protein n=1 Tax=Gaoshiqia sediminis TaxID=2986998 RepID=A0AA41YE91_9BACT|nr:SNF2-related protein [Gaoshiqia sediminis]MCW0484092.1 SNF2-related protein [Gaoshiqia sediminis]